MATPSGQQKVSIPVEVTPFTATGTFQVEAISQNGNIVVARDLAMPRQMIRIDLAAQRPGSPPAFTRTHALYRSDASLAFHDAIVSPSGDRVIVRFKNQKTGRISALHWNGADSASADEDFHEGAAVSKLTSGGSTVVAISGDLASTIAYAGQGKFTVTIPTAGRYTKQFARHERPLLVQFFHDARFFFVYRRDTIVIYNTLGGIEIARYVIPDALRIEPTYFWLSRDDSTLLLYTGTQALKITLELQPRTKIVGAAAVSMNAVAAYDILPPNLEAAAQQNLVIHRQAENYVFAETRDEKARADYLLRMHYNGNAIELVPSELLARPTDPALPKNLPRAQEHTSEFNRPLHRTIGSIAMWFIPVINFIAIPAAFGFAAGAAYRGVKIRQASALRRKEARQDVPATTFYKSAVFTIEGARLVASAGRRLYAWQLHVRPNAALAQSYSGTVPAAPHTLKRVGSEACHQCGQQTQLMEDEMRQRPFCGQECQADHYVQVAAGQPWAEWIQYDSDDV